MNGGVGRCAIGVCMSWRHCHLSAASSHLSVFRGTWLCRGGERILTCSRLPPFRLDSEGVQLYEAEIQFDKVKQKQQRYLPERARGKYSMAYSCVGACDIEILHPDTLKTIFASSEAHRFLDIESCSPFSTRNTLSVLRKYSADQPRSQIDPCIANHLDYDPRRWCQCGNEEYINQPKIQWDPFA